MKRKLALVLAFLVANFFTAAWAAEVVIPDAGLKAGIWESLGKRGPVGTLTEQDMLNLTNLNAVYLGVKSLDGLGAAHNLATLNLEGNQMTSLTLPAGFTRLTTLNLGNNQLTSLTLPAGLTNLTALWLNGNQLTNLTLPAGLTDLTMLDLHNNQLTNPSLPNGLTNLTTLELSFNLVTRLTLPDGLTSLTWLDLYANQLTNLTLPAGLTSLNTLNLRYNRLTSLTLPAGLTSLTTLYLIEDIQMASLTLPPDLTSLTTLRLDGIFLQSFVLSQPLADGALAGTVAYLMSEGFLISTYPLAISLVARPWSAPGAFKFLLKGPPGTYRIQVTPDFSSWKELNSVTNVNGSVLVTDPSADGRPQGFYRAIRSK